MESSPGRFLDLAEALETMGEELDKQREEQELELARALEALESEGGLHSGQERWNLVGNTAACLAEMVGDKCLKS